MAQHIHKCPEDQKYTLESVCLACGGSTVLPQPPKFSWGDKYAGLRREVKRKELKEKGWY